VVKIKLMKISIIACVFLFSTIANLPISSQNIQLETVKMYVKYYNTADINGIDSILSDNCKSFSKKVTLEKNEMLDIIRNLSKNEHIEIKEINSLNNTVKTKEVLTDDIINYLGLTPIIRKREYNFDHQYNIKSIFNIDVIFPDDFEEKQNKFFEWADKYYPELYQNMIQNYSEGENISEERRFLLTLLNEEGLQVLDSISSEKEKIIEIKEEEKIDKIEPFKENAISFVDFRKKVLLKTKDEIEILFGIACDKKKIAGKHFIYYGRMICPETYQGPRIYYTDKMEDIQQVQIEFDDSGIAVSVNAI
jgi:hypothetical protein